MPFLLCIWMYIFIYINRCAFTSYTTEKVHNKYGIIFNMIVHSLYIWRCACVYLSYVFWHLSIIDRHILIKYTHMWIWHCLVYFLFYVVLLSFVYKKWKKMYKEFLTGRFTSKLLNIRNEFHCIIMHFLTGMQMYSILTCMSRFI